MSEPRTKDGAVFKIGMPLVTERGVRFSTAGFGLEFKHGHWALFRKGQDQGFKLNCFYSSPTARFAAKLNEARAKREFWAAQEARFEEFIKANETVATRPN